MTEQYCVIFGIFCFHQQKCNYNFLKNISKLTENKILVLYKTINLNY